jgi:hypothetical protein
MRVREVILHDESLVRLDAYAGMFRTTWAANGNQFVALADGIDMATPARKTFHARIYALRGDPPRATFEELPRYPETPWRKKSDQAQFWSGSCLAVDGRVYQYLMTANHAYLKPDGCFWPDLRWAGVKLIYSPDNGITWCNQDGSSPVTWEPWAERSKANMLFFEEDGAALMTPIFPTFLQMGRGYSANTDGYVYAYATNGDVRETGNQLILLRAPRDRVLDRAAYEFCTGVDVAGGAGWSRDIKERRAIHEFPPGWMSTNVVEGQFTMGWSVNVVYNEALRVYIMAAQGIGVAENGGWYGKPSYLGFWVARSQWGPFRQVHEDTTWMPGNDPAARAINPEIPAKWIAADGRSFWLVWSDYQFHGSNGENEHPDKSFNEISRDIVDDAELARAVQEWSAVHMPRTKFNLQRVALQLGA